MIEYPLQREQQVYLGPDLNRSCFNLTAIDDNVQEPDELVSIFLIEGDKTNVQVINRRLQVYILDDDSEYINYGPIFSKKLVKPKQCHNYVDNLAMHLSVYHKSRNLY